MSVDFSDSSLFSALLVFTRASALFLFSPLFLNRAIPLPIRLLMTLLFSITLTPLISQFPNLTLTSQLLMLAKEFLFGYLIGTLFALIFEGALLTGQVIGVLSGFSVTELVDPNQPHRGPLSSLFLLLVASFLLSLDLHHLVLYFLHETFLQLPLSFERNTLLETALSGSMLFRFALDWALGPSLILITLLFLLAIFSKFNLQLPIYWVAFPLQLLVGFIALSLFLPLCCTTLQELFKRILQLISKLIFPL